MTDKGACYKSRSFHAACQALGLKHTLTKPYTPKTNSKAERLIPDRAQRMSPCQSLHDLRSTGSRAAYLAAPIKLALPASQPKIQNISRLGLFEANLLRLRI
jgi:transposase InsO family protein